MSRLTRILFISIFLLVSNSVSCRKILKKPTVLVGMLIRNKAHTLPYFLSLFEALDYPKDRMALCIRSDNNIDNTLEILQFWLDAKRHKYHSIDLIIDEESSGLPEEKGVADWPLSRFLHVINLREGILNLGRKIWADYVFMLDADVFLTNPASLNSLIAKKKTIVGPLLKSDGMYSNFWAGIAPDYYYVRTEKYEPIYNRQELGCHPVPMVHSALLIDLNRKESDSLTYNFENLNDYDGPKDDVITFAMSANRSDIPFYVCNDEIYGYITVPLQSQDSLKKDFDQLMNIKLEILGYQSNIKLSEGLQKFVEYPKKDKLDFDEIYMINLKRRPERRNRMDQCFKELGIQAEMIDAVDGRSLNERSLEEWGVKIIPDYVDPYHKRPMTMGEIGCFLSHYTVWKDTADKNYERVMVLEDDVRFEPYFRQKIAIILEEIERLQLEWDLIYLGRKRLLDQDEPYVKDTKFLVHVGYSYWTLGYLLSKNGAKKLLAAKPLEKLVPVDEYLPILFDQHPRTSWKKYFPKRDLIALSVIPYFIYPTHYTGESGYTSDTENSTIISATKDREDL